MPHMGDCPRGRGALDGGHASERHDQMTLRVDSTGIYDAPAGGRGAASATPKMIKITPCLQERGERA